ncbi:MAG: GTP-dependent dephospho-CoA kinase family protein [Sulfolobales archaeon]
MRILKLPDALRGELRKVMGTLFSGDRRSVAASVVRAVGNCSRLWAVGDVVCLSVVDLFCIPKVCVVDGKTLRSVGLGVPESVRNVFREVLRVRNPPGCISEEALNAIKYCVGRDGVLILVDGEEDLLGLPVLAYADLGDYLVYGVPGIGVDLVEVSDVNRRKAVDLMSRFVEEEFSA